MDSRTGWRVVGESWRRVVRAGGGPRATDSAIATLRLVIAATWGLVAAAIYSRHLLWPSASSREGLRLSYWWRVGSLARDDARLVLLIADVALIALLLLRHRPHGARVLARVYGAAAIVLAVILGENVTAVMILHEPLNLGWLYAADLFTGFTVKTVLDAVVTGDALVALASTLLSAGLTAGAIWWLLRRAPVSLVSATIATLCALVFLARFGSPIEGPQKGRMVDPVFEFVLSNVGALQSPLSHLESHESTADYRIGRRSAPVAPAAHPAAHVIVIVLESVPAEAVYRSAVPLPGIERLRREGTSFTSAYVPMPLSTRSAFALLMSRYPLASLQPETYTLADASLVSLPERMHRAGWRTAFFMGGDLGYQRLGGFLGNKGFDRLADVGTIPCQRRYRPHAGSTLDIHVADACVVENYLAWRRGLGADHSFAVLWTIETHWPYLAGSGLPAGSRAAFERSLQSSDQAVATLLGAIDRSGQAGDTLVLVMGDHGESFGKHGFATHGNTVLDQETRVPMIVRGPGVAAGTADPHPRSTIDVAPFVLSAAGLSPERSWQGRDLFAPGDRQRVYSLDVRRSLEVAYRNGPLKDVVDAWSGRVMQYDLTADPGEDHPTVLTGAAAELVRRRAAAWVQYDNALYGR